MTLEEFEARDRARLFALYRHVKSVEATLYAQRDLLRAGAGVVHGFGVWDEEDDLKVARANAERGANIANVQVRLDQNARVWNAVKDAFTPNTVLLAIEEGERRIGSLPYVE